MEELPVASHNHSVNAVVASTASTDLTIIQSEALILASRGELSPSIEERIARLGEKLLSLETSIADQANLLAILSIAKGE